MTYLAYVDGSRAVLIERSNRIERFVFANDLHTVRGQSGMYPMLPPVEPVEVDKSTFEEAWAAGA